MSYFLLMLDIKKLPFFNIKNLYLGIKRCWRTEYATRVVMLLQIDRVILILIKLALF